MTTGSIKWFDDAKGFGFIEQNEGDDVFYHVSNVEFPREELEEGLEVEIELEETEEGLAASKVEKANQGEGITVGETTSLGEQ